LGHFIAQKETTILEFQELLRAWSLIIRNWGRTLGKLLSVTFLTPKLTDVYFKVLR